MSWRGWLGVAALCLAAGGAGFGAYRAWFAGPSAQALRPDLEFQGLDGQRHRLSEWDGRVLLVNFWASWCAPCLEEIPLLVAAQQQHGARGLQIVGVALDEAAMARSFQQRFGIGYPMMYGEADVIAAMDALGDQVGALPFSVVIGRDGRILERITGGLERDELAKLLESHLN